MPRGRRKGVPNKLKTSDLEVVKQMQDVDSKMLAALPVTYKQSPKMILLATMEHFHNLGVIYAHRAQKFAEASGGDEKSPHMAKADTLAKVSTGFLLNAADCAAKAAPFVHAKIAEGATDNNERFVMRMPSVARDAQEWTASVGSQAAPVVDQSTTIVGETRAPVEDTEEPTREPYETEVGPRAPSYRIRLPARRPGPTEAWLQEVERSRKS